MVITTEQWVEFTSSRRTTRDFLPTPVSQEIIDAILADGMTAPSWSNTRPFLIGVATGAKRDRISQELLKRWAVARHARMKGWAGLKGKLRLAFTPWAWPINDYNMTRPYPKELQPRSRKVGKDLYNLLGVARGDADARDAHWARNYEFFGAPVEFFIFAHSGLGVYSVSDASLFVENLVLSAHARGLATCAQGAVAMWAKPVKREFKLPKGYKLMYGVALGYASDNVANTFKAERLPISEIVAPSAN
jgi:nitroreductase